MRAATRIELHAKPSEFGVRIEGTLFDDLGVGLAAREVVVRADTDDAHGTPAASGTARTDVRGAFAIELQASGDRQRVRCSYDGDDFYERSEHAELFDLALADVTLTLSLPHGHRIAIDGDATFVDLRARSEAGGGGLSFVITDELGREVAAGRTDEDGHWVSAIPSTRLGAPGVGALIATSTGDGARTRASTQLTVLRALSTQIELDANVHREQGVIEVRGVARSTRGPLAHKAVGVFADGQHAATVLTDVRGTFFKELRLPDLLDAGHTKVQLQARFEPDAPWLLASASKSIGVDLPTPVLPSALGLIFPVLVSLGLALWLARKARPRVVTPDLERASVPGMHFMQVPRRMARTLHVIDGRVEDASNGAPLTAASVIVIAADGSSLPAPVHDDGQFETPALEAGRYTLQASAPGYAHVEAGVSLPHAGEASGIRVGLVSLRVLAITAHRPLLRRLVPIERLVRIWTPRDALLHVHAEARDTSELAPLTERVEHAAYAGPTPTREELEAIEQQSRDLLAKLDPPRPRVPRWDR